MVICAAVEAPARGEVFPISVAEASPEKRSCSRQLSGESASMESDNSVAV